MHHCKAGRKLNRNSSHRTSLFRNLITALVKCETIKTTLPKAKELRRFVEPLITLSKKDSVANRRLAFARIRDRDSVTKLFRDIGPFFAKRDQSLVDKRKETYPEDIQKQQCAGGGYTRVLKCGFRTGDKAPMAYIQLVDFSNQQNPSVQK